MVNTSKASKTLKLLIIKSWSSHIGSHNLANSPYDYKSITTQATIQWHDFIIISFFQIKCFIKPYQIYVSSLIKPFLV